MGVLLYFFVPFVAMQLDEVEIDVPAIEEVPTEQVPVIEVPFTEPPIVEAPIEQAPIAQQLSREPLAQVPVVDALPSIDVPHEQTQAERDLAGALHQRERVTDVHRGFGIAAWLGMTATVILGGIQIHDDYGPFAFSEMETPCNTSSAIFPEFCGDAIPWPHMTAGIVTGTLYYTAASMAFFAMPDPLHLDSQDNERGERLRVHKALRWVHTITMLLTTALGTITANLPANEVDFGVRQGLALAHMGLGGLTWIFLTAAALVMF